MASRPPGHNQMASLSFFDLTVFDAMMRLRSVTLAADELEIPQSSMSRYLQALREHFRDALFVRTRNGMVPTSVALSIARSVEDSLHVYRTSLGQRRKFEPESSTRNFRIAASDLGQLYIIPLLQKRALQAAPHIHFTSVEISKNRLLSDLEMGTADVALGSFPSLYPTVREEPLFREPYVCIAPARFIKSGRIDLADYRELYHIVVAGLSHGHAHQDAEQRILQVIDSKKLRIVAENFIVSALIAEMSDLVLTVPLSVARVMRSAHMMIVPPPIELPTIAINQYWHKRFDKDPGHSWLRSLIGESRLEHMQTINDFQTHNGSISTNDQTCTSHEMIEGKFDGPPC